MSIQLAQRLDFSWLVVPATVRLQGATGILATVHEQLFLTRGRPVNFGQTVW